MKETCYLEGRLTKLEWQMAEHEVEIKEVHKTSALLHDSLNEIKTCLQQIKYTAFGAILIIVMKTLGVGQTLALLVP
jgi:uncharacterized coiled-coil protein SlyX